MADIVTVEKRTIIKLETPDGKLLKLFDTFNHKDQPLARLLEEFEKELWEAMFRKEDEPNG